MEGKTNSSVTSKELGSQGSADVSHTVGRDSSSSSLGYRVVRFRSLSGDFKFKIVGCPMAILTSNALSATMPAEGVANPRTVLVGLSSR